MPLPSRWTSIFSPTPKPWPTLGLQGLSAPVGKTAALVLRRSLYRVRHVSLSDVPAGERRAVLRNLCIAWQPFDDSEHRVHLKDDTALLFAWDRRLASQFDGPIEWWPETCLRQPMAGDGLRVLQLAEGVEAEWRQAGGLRASRWWPEAPSPDERNAWLQGLGNPGAASVWPEAEAPTDLLRPAWSVQDLDSLTRAASRTERTIALVLCFSLSGLAGAAGMQAWQGHRTLKSAQQAHDEQRSAQAPLMRQSDEVKALAADIQAIEQAFDQPSSLLLLAHLAPLLKPGVDVRELELKGRQVRLVVTWPAGVPRSTLIQDLQSGGWLRNVKELREGQVASAAQIAVEGELSGTSPPLAVPTPASGAGSPSFNAPSLSPSQAPLPGMPPEFSRPGAPR